jgi:hypothetical protein
MNDLLFVPVVKDRFAGFSRVTGTHQHVLGE